jgi:hypothetical protein
MAVYFERSTYSGAEPISLTEAKAFLRVDSSDDDSYITELITMTRDFIEKETNTALVSNTYTEYRNGFPTTDGGVITLQINGDLTINNQAPQVAFLKDGVWTNLHDGTELLENGDFEELGAEEVTNGDFTTDTDWGENSATIAINTTTETLTYTVTPLGGYAITAASVFDVGVRYLVEIDIASISGGIKFLASGDGTTFSPIYTAAGKYQHFINRAEGSGKLEITTTETTTAEVNSISVKEVDPNDYWTLGTGWTIDVDKVTQTGSTSFLSYDSFSPTIGIKYEVVYTVSEYTSGFTSIDFAGSSLVFTESSLGTFSYEITATTTDKFQIKSTDFVGAINSISIIPFTVDYFSSEFNGLPRVEPNGGWSVTPDDRLNSVKIIYTAAPPEAGVIAPPLKQAMYLLLAHYYDNRSAVTFGNPKELPLGYKRIINNYKNPIWS